MFPQHYSVVLSACMALLWITLYLSASIRIYGVFTDLLALHGKIISIILLLRTLDTMLRVG